MADTAFIKYGTSKDATRLFYSEPSASRRIPRTVQAGYGILDSGLVMAANASPDSPNLGKMVPYDPAAVTGKEIAPGRAYLVADSGTANNTLEVSIDDAGKFAVGDLVTVKDDTTSAEDLGAITAIDTTTYSHKAIITVTTNIGGTAFTVARFAYITITGATTAVGILGKTVDTLSGQNALDGNSVLILGNALLYSGVCNTDAGALNDLNASIVSQFLNIP